MKWLLLVVALPVVGMMTWSGPETDRTLTWAQSVFALKRPCP